MIEILVGICAGAGAFFMCFFSYCFGYNNGIKTDVKKPITIKKPSFYIPKPKKNKENEEDMNSYIDTLMNYSIEDALKAIKKGD